MDIILENIRKEYMQRFGKRGSDADLTFEAGALWGIQNANKAIKKVNDPKVIYLIGSLKNSKIPLIANQLREIGFEVFDDWFSPGPEADDFWRTYEKTKGSTHQQALKNYAGRHIYEFDKFHIDRSNIGILIMPAGKSGHLELGYIIGQGKPGFILFEEEPEKWDIMHIFSKENGGDICYSFEELQKGLLKLK